MCETKKLVWIVIPTWNRRDDLLECLDSLKSVEYDPFHILIIDNASEDGSADEVNRKYPQYQVIRLKENIGAPAASNIGFELALSNGAEFILRLDSDTVVPPDFLTPLTNHLTENPITGIVSPKIFFYNSTDEVWYDGVDAHPFHFGAIHSRQNPQPSHAPNKAKVVDYVWGAAMLIRKEVLLETGGFDTDFFIYYEEIDFCKRVQALGYSLAYMPDSHILHKVGSAKHNAWTAYQWNKSKMLLFRKHARNNWHKFSLVTYAYLYALASPIYKGGRSGNRGPLKHTLKGLYDGLRQKI